MLTGRSVPHNRIQPESRHYDQAREQTSDCVAQSLDLCPVVRCYFGVESLAKRTKEEVMAAPLALG